VSLIWLVPWLRWAPRDTAAHRASQPPGAVMQILRLRQAWATFLGLFFFNYSFYFLLTWLPSYLVMERQFSFRAMAVFGALPFAATAAASLFCGAFSDRLIRSGRDVSAVRKGFVLTGLLVCAVALPVAALVDPVPAMAALILAFTAIGLYTSNVWAISQTLAGPRAAGTWTGLQNAAGNMGGVVAPILTGVIVAATGSFVPAFLLCAAMLLGSALCYGLWIGRVAPVDWRS
jgi:MFS transporter, ACS family, D-galactonate transporter